VTPKIIPFKPKVYLVGRQVVNEYELSRFLDDHDVSSWETPAEVGGEKLIEVAGRICYMSFARPRPGGNKAYIDHILDVGHGSVLEHEVFNLIITGVSRSFTHELVRHRAGFGFSQLSQRYVDASDCEFIVHPGLEPLRYWYELETTGQVSPEEMDQVQRDASAAYAEFLLAVEACQGAYLRMSAALVPLLKRAYATTTVVEPELGTALRKQAREATREILPNCTETKIFVTGNARALRHFIEMRGSVHADQQIRGVALAVLDVLAKASPNVFGDYVVSDGCVTTPNRKV
jgi:thymidylate synthase (FAD)